ncbi:MAG: hypothetical protein H0T42_07910 [Deltaproteobacteria bacterium]|nr:hypothetical protein [Deltaproteobacteria bacterium]
MAFSGSLGAARPRIRYAPDLVRVVLAGIAVALGAQPALADEEPKRPISVQRQALGIAAALIPGVIVRGTGSAIVREQRAGKRLAVIGGIGLGAMLVGGLPVGITGGNQYLIVPGVPLLIAGTGLFMTSWFSDLWVAAGGRCGAGDPRARSPLSIEAGTTWLHDAYRERALLRGAVQLAVGRVELSAGVLHDARGAATEGELGARVRIHGAAPTGAVIEDGSGIWIRAAARGRDDDEDRVQVATAEIEAILRVDLHRIDVALRGAFSELSSGLGVERAELGNDRHETGALLLARFAWGAYLGQRGEISAFYSHRRDQLAGGLPAGGASGFLGSVGATLDLRVLGPWAVRGELEIGSAWVTTLVLRYQGRSR